jgi:hypothetical protein
MHLIRAYGTSFVKVRSLWTVKSEARRRYLERHYQLIDPATVLNIKDLLRARETEVYAKGRDGRPALGKRERNLLDHLIKEDKLDAGIRLVKLEDANTVGGAGPTATHAPSTGTGYEGPYTLSQMRRVLSCIPPTSIRGVLRVSLSPSSS